MWLSTTVVAAVLATRAYTAPFFQSASFNIDCFTSASTIDRHVNSNKANANFCALHLCQPGFGPIIVNNECICSQCDVVPDIEKRQEFEVDEAHICAARVCPPRFGGVITNGTCECIQLVGLRPTPSTTVSTTIQPTKTPTVKHVKRQDIDEDASSVVIRQEIVEDEAIICAVRVCPPRFGGVITNGTCECIQLVGLRPTPSTISTTIQPTKIPTVGNVKRQEIDEDSLSLAIRQEIVEDEAIICAVRVCPPRFGAILVDGVCTCTRFGLPPPATPTAVKRSETAYEDYEDCETPCHSGYTGRIFGEFCRCTSPIHDNVVFTNAITERQEVDNCFARTCPPRFFSAPDGNGGCDCVQGTKFAPPTA